MRSSLVALVLLAAEPRLVERVLAVVDGRPVLLSEVETLGAVRGVDAKDALRLLIDERLMYALAARVPQAAVSETEADAALAALKERRAGLLSVDEAEARRLVVRQLAILKYVEFRFRPQVRVTDEDLQRAYEEEYGGRPEAPPFAEAEAPLRAAAERRQLDQKVEAWIAELRSAADVRYVSPPAGS
jgi:hypothetical protein